MSEFSSRIRQVSERLPIPEPTRSRILLEIATDMEDLFQHYRSQGTAAEEARLAVEEHFDLSEEALQELVRVHTSPLQRSLEGLSVQIRTPWERGVLALVAVIVILGLVPHLLQAPLYRAASPLAFGLLGVLAWAVGTALWRGVALFRPGSQGGRAPVSRRGIKSLPLLALLLLGLGFAGVWVELYRAALVIRGSPDMALPQLVYWLYLASATLVVAISGALLTGLLWYFLETRAAHLEQRAASTLLAEGE